MVAGLLASGMLLGAAAAPPAAAQLAPADDVARADAEIARLRAEADALAGRYFDALAALADLERRVDEIGARIPALTAEAERLRALTRQRAVAAYKRSGHDLGTVIDADGPLAAARRAQWLDRLNERDGAIADDLRATSARLAAQRAELRTAREAAVTALDEVRAQGQAIDTLLGQARDRRDAAVSAAAAATAAATTTTTAPSAATTPTRPRPGTTNPAPPPPPVAPPSYAPTPGVHPRHDEPFLVCTRARESSGNYAAVNPAGPYYGAYQFLQATWNSAANHAGRPELIGVPPSVASRYDQDDLAWALYQWQGSRPWGGYCDEG